MRPCGRRRASGRYSERERDGLAALARDRLAYQADPSRAASSSLNFSSSKSVTICRSWRFSIRSAATTSICRR